MRLNDLSLHAMARIDSIDWTALTPADGRRLRELGFGDGVAVSVERRGGWSGRGPLACKVGRMLVAIQRVHASAISVEPAAAA